MAKKKKAQSGAKKNGAENDFIFVDPARVPFQHSRIRPLFSGCGRSITETLESIRRHELAPEDLPPIQVLVGPVGEDEQTWYFSLNNRRLWVLKRCREEGLLKNNQIRVRVRSPKSSGEESRYTIENCALEAKLMREPSNASSQKPDQTSQNLDEERKAISSSIEQDKGDSKSEQHVTPLGNPDDESSTDDDSIPKRSNPFSVLF